MADDLLSDQDHAWFEKTYGDDPRRRPVRQADGWAAWRAWSDSVERRLAVLKARRDTAMVGAIGDVLAGVRAELQAEHAREIAAVRAELEALRGQLDAARRLDDVAERLERLEAAPPAKLRALP
jgi:hypothetical protein